MWSRARTRARSPQGTRRLGQTVHVDQPVGAPIAEPVGERRPAGVRDDGVVEGRNGGSGTHHATPRDCAAATPARQPSSWKPQPW